MYEWLEIENFRGFQSLRLSEFKRVNLIAGMNNVGKTNLLDAIFLHTGAYNPGLIMTIRGLRGFDRLKIDQATGDESPFAYLFHNKQTDKSIRFSSKDTATGERETELTIQIDPDELPSLISYGTDVTQENAHAEISIPAIASSINIAPSLKFISKTENSHFQTYLVVEADRMLVKPSPPRPPFTAYYVSSRGPAKLDVELYSNLIKRDKKHIINNAIRLIDQRIQDILLLTEADQTRLWVKLDFGLIPLLDMGQGVARLSNYALRIANADDGITLIDEIENGLHYSVLTALWGKIGELAAEFNTQIFATTHSLECIRAAHEAFSQTDTYDFRLFRLQRARDNSITAVSYDQETLETALETGLEVR